MFKLVRKDTGEEVPIGTELHDHSDTEAVETWVITGWRESQHIGSSGRIFVRPKGPDADSFDDREFFPHTFDLAIVPVSATLRPARIANKVKYNPHVYREALDVQGASNLSGVAHGLSNTIRAALWPEAHALGEGTDYVAKHPVTSLFLHQMAHLNGSHADLLGDGWAKAERHCRDMAGDFREDFGSLCVYEAVGGFYVTLIRPGGGTRSMGDGVDRYSDETGASYNVGTPEFYALLRADVRDNHDALIEAYFGEGVAQ